MLLIAKIIYNKYTNLTMTSSTHDLYYFSDYYAFNYTISNEQNYEKSTDRKQNIFILQTRSGGGGSKQINFVLSVAKIKRPILINISIGQIVFIACQNKFQ